MSDFIMLTKITHIANAIEIMFSYIGVKIH